MFLQELQILIVAVLLNSVPGGFPPVVGDGESATCVATVDCIDEENDEENQEVPERIGPSPAESPCTGAKLDSSVKTTDVRLAKEVVLSLISKAVNALNLAIRYVEQKLTEWMRPTDILIATVDILPSSGVVVGSRTESSDSGS